MTFQNFQLYSNRYLTKKYLKSKWCEYLMRKHLDENSDLFHLADHPVSKSFTFRHFNMIHINSWRWLCNWRYRDFLMELVFSDKKGIDFGGALGTIGGNTVIVDNVSRHLKIDDIDNNSLDYIFTSHTLEHISNLAETLIKLYNKLKKGGIIYIVVPSYTCKRWRVDAMNSHVWNFSLEDNIFTRIDEKVKNAGFKINKAEYTWDDSIVIFGEKL